MFWQKPWWSMRPERLYLEDIVEAADAIGRFVAASDKEAFLSDDLVSSAVLQKLTVSGKAAARLPREFRETHQEIAWADIVGLRNIAVHAYFAVDWDLVWAAATRSAPELRGQVAAILAAEFPEDA